MARVPIPIDLAGAADRPQVFSSSKSNPNSNSDPNSIAISNSNCSSDAPWLFRVSWPLTVVTMLVSLTACGVTGAAEQPDWAADAQADLEQAGLDPEVVTCVLDLAAQDLKRGPLTELGSEEAVRHCRDARISVRDRETIDLPNTELGMTDVPWTFGDDAELDELWARCEQGEGSACDELFQRSAVGSDYEEFGISCGHRPDLVDCGELDRPDSEDDQAGS